MGHARLVSGCPVASTECSAAGWRHSQFPATKKSGQVLVRTMSSKSGESPKDSGGMSGVLKLAMVSTTPPDPYVTTLLEQISEGKNVMSVRKGKKIFSQGDAADAIYFVQ